LGGLVNVEQVKQSPLLRQLGAPLVESARLFASPVIRHRATVGGNLADASPAADMAPPLLALGAEVALSSVEGTRYEALDTFFLGPRRTTRRMHELLTEIRYPAPGASARTSFLKLGLRNADAISVVSVATYLDLDGDRVRDLRIALGAVAPVPLRARQAEAALIGQPLTEERVREAARVAAQADVRPIDDVRGSAEYRRWMVEVMVRRALWEGQAK
jgi:carbon-monoxide dehydrogenase medium subunit